jgi:beta-glucanase (GH16 family)
MVKWCGYDWECCMEGGRKIHPECPWVWYSEECTTVGEDGVLHLNIKRDPTTIVYYDGRTFNPEIAGGTIRSCKSFSYGTFSADIKMPKGSNLLPSFWSTGDKNWPPEIDIAEAWSGDCSYFKWTVPQFPYFCPSWRTTTNIHYSDVEGNNEHESIGSKNIPWCKQRKDPSENFVRYKCVWLPDSVKFYADGRLVRKVGKDIATKIRSDSGMDVVLNLWCENPEEYRVSIDTEMLAKNFTYTPA